MASKKTKFSVTILQKLWQATLIAVLTLGPELAYADIPSVYLIQNSGWMEPFFADKASNFRPLLGALVDASHSDGDVILASFNQDGQINGRRSPNIVYRGPYNPQPVQEAIGAVDLPRRPGGKYADADFNGALMTTINDVLAGRSGIVWIVTNNKNSPNNSQEVNLNTRSFAEALSRSEHLPRVVAYPIRMPVKGASYEERGLIIYGVAYGDEAADALRNLVESDRMKGLFPDPAVQLKPLERAPLVFTPTAVTTKGVTAVNDQGVLVLSGVSAGERAVIEIRGTLRSEYYPHVIDSAGVTLGWEHLEQTDNAAELSASVQPDVLHRMAPADILEDVVIRFTVPDVPRPPGLDGLYASSQTLNGVLSLGLRDVHLVLLDKFVSKISDITALDQLPAVFFDYKNVSVASTRLPVQVKVVFSSTPLILTIVGGVLLVASLFGGFFFLSRDREHTIQLAGRSQRVRLRPFETKRFPSPNGGVTSVTGSLFGRASVRTRPGSKPRA